MESRMRSRARCLHESSLLTRSTNVSSPPYGGGVPCGPQLFGRGYAPLPGLALEALPGLALEALSGLARDALSGLIRDALPGLCPDALPDLDLVRAGACGR